MTRKLSVASRSTSTSVSNFDNGPDLPVVDDGEHGLPAGGEFPDPV
jgi:hypothetical protein